MSTIAIHHKESTHQLLAGEKLYRLPMPELCSLSPLSLSFLSHSLPSRSSPFPFSPLSILMAIVRWTLFSHYQNVSIPDFIGAKDDTSGGYNWSCKTCKGPVKLPPPTNQNPAFLQAGCFPVA